MTVPNTTHEASYTLNGVTTVYAYNWKIWASSDLRVTLRDSSDVAIVLTEGANYTVSGVGLAGGGNVTLLSAYTNGWHLLIDTDMPQTQGTNLRNQSDYHAEVIEDSLDKQVRLIHQLQGEVDRSVRMGHYYPYNDYNMVIDTPPVNGSVLGWVVDKFKWVASATADLATWLLDSSNTALGDALIAVKQPWTGSVARTQHCHNQDLKSVLDFMTDAQRASVRAETFSVDVTLALQAAFDYSTTKNVGLWFPCGGYAISNSLKLGTATRIYGENMVRTVIKMMTLPTAAVPVYTGSTSHPPTLDYHPILYNASGIQWGSIENITLHGNDLNVYGLRLQENFYMDFDRVLITRCNKAPYINIRGQSINHRHLVLFENKGGMITYNNTSMTFNTCGFEKLNCTRPIQILTPFSTKSGIGFHECWFEDDVAPWNTTGPIITVAGRNPVFDNCAFIFSATTPLLECVGTAYSITVDGITMVNDSGCINGYFLVNAVAGARDITFSSDSYGNRIDGVFNAPAITDNSGRNYWFHNVTVGASTYYRNFTNGPLEWATSTGPFLKVDPVTTRMTLWGGTSNNYIGLASGIFEIGCAASFRLTCANGSGGMEFITPNTAGTNFEFHAAVTGKSTWDKGHIILSPYHLWVHQTTGKLYIKNGAPTSETDGTIIGPP